ncbi:MAG: GNAT family N-acetyltransferase [Candidatus Uhrbacteria bacterium]
MSEQTVYIRGPQVSLRPIEPGDTERYYRWMNDRDVTQWLGFNLPIPIEAERAWVDRYAKERPTDNHVLAVILNDTGDHIGTVGLHGIHWIDRVAETGWMIGAKEHWRKGCGSEMVMLILRYAFATLNLRKVVSSALATNVGSNRIHERCGYRLIGQRRAHVYRNGVYVDMNLYELFAEDFDRAWCEYMMPDHAHCIDDEPAA